MEEVRTDLSEIASLVKGNIERELLLRNEYLAAENEALRSRIEGRLLLLSDEKARLALSFAIYPAADSHVCS